MAVTTERRGEVLVIHLDDGRANAVTLELIAELTEAVRRADADPEVKALVLHGREGRFSGGFDLGVMRSGDMRAIAELASGGGLLVHTLYGADLPVVIACTGHAIAMGAMLLMSGDQRVGADGDFKIGMNELAIGISLPDWALTILLERLDRRRVQEALMTARLYGPSEAVEVGYLDEVVAPERVLDRAMEIAEGLAATIDLKAYATTARTLRGSMLAALEAQALAFRDGGVI